ncbi:unnamed protein product [Cuscuta europaea]|uniref:Uncharacterized protein n=1 Tax=Cuscuta europaea TaxID=41803 RepID=A0A9P1ELZ7_CUSEU|nr:unnamed protein product [Cuscuta europaea]
MGRCRASTPIFDCFGFSLTAPIWYTRVYTYTRFFCNCLQNEGDQFYGVECLLPFILSRCFFLFVLTLHYFYFTFFSSPLSIHFQLHLVFACSSFCCFSFFFVFHFF